VAASSMAVWETATSVYYGGYKRHFIRKKPPQYTIYFVVIPQWFCATRHWLARASPLPLERPEFLPSGDSAEALAQLGLPLVASPAHPCLLLGSALGFVLALICGPRWPHGGPSWHP